MIDAEHSDKLFLKPWEDDAIITRSGFTTCEASEFDENARIKSLSSLLPTNQALLRFASFASSL
jgi:hypothetical protein